MIPFAIVRFTENNVFAEGGILNPCVLWAVGKLGGHGDVAGCAAHVTGHGGEEGGFARTDGANNSEEFVMANGEIDGVEFEGFDRGVGSGFCLLRIRDGLLLGGGVFGGLVLLRGFPGKIAVCDGDGSFSIRIVVNGFRDFLGEEILLDTLGSISKNLNLKYGILTSSDTQASIVCAITCGKRFIGILKLLNNANEEKMVAGFMLLLSETEYVMKASILAKTGNDIPTALTAALKPSKN